MALQADVLSADDRPGQLHDWRTAYRRLLDRLDEHVRAARLTLCGFCTVTDAVVSLHAAEALFAAAEPPEAVALAALLRDRMARGIGGEFRYDWDGGQAWLDQHLEREVALGGTAAHAAQALAACGAPALLALSDRSERKLSRLHPDILLAEEGRAVRAADARVTSEGVPHINIFEYTAGRPAGGVVPARSTRTIMRLHDPDLDLDPDFHRLGLERAREAGAGLVCGFNALGRRDAEPVFAQARRIAGDWRRAGIRTIHHELAGFETAELRDRAIAAMAPVTTSLGMSHSEFNEIVGPGLDLPAAMVRLGQHLGLRRISVHADEWAASATLDDPARERAALMTGCLLAGTRAATGVHQRPAALAAEASLLPPPFAERRVDGWEVVVVPAPYLARPKTTLGLGDTFAAGTLMILSAG